MSQKTSGDYVARRPSRADREALARFARKIWPAGRPDVLEGRWWWNGPGEPQAWVVEHLPSRDIAAMCGARETEVEVDGRREPAASIGDWYVAPEHAGKGLGRMLVMESASRHAVMYTTTISEAAATAFKRMGWRSDEELPLFMGATPAVAALAGRRPRGVELRSDVVSAGAAAARVDDLDAVWAATAGERPIGAPRDAARLRSHLALVPHRQYRLARAYRSGVPLGYLLWRVLPAGSFRRLPYFRIGLLSDFFVRPGEQAAFAALVGSVARSLLVERCGVMLALATRHAEIATLTRLGFASPRLPLVGKSLRALSSRGMYRSERDLGTLIGSWHITIADNDMDFAFGSAVELPSRPPA
jgi:GNAT superfamily N-acetyltransferase